MRTQDTLRHSDARPVARTIGSLAALLLLAGHATAQCEPTVAWRVEAPGLLQLEPAIGPDGEVAVQGRELVVVEPDGTVRFRDGLGQFLDTLGVDIGPDGTIYATSLDGPVALDRDGRELWRTDLPAGVSFHEPVAGPNVGPDGNIYYAGDQAVGIASLTPEGDLRWRSLGFGPRRTPNITNVLFFEDRAIVADCCLALGPGAVALDADDGSTQWFTGVVGTQRAAMMSSGDVVIGERPPGYTRIDASDGDIIATPLPTQTVTSWDVAPGPDGVGYSVGSLQNLLRIPTSGTIEVIGRLPMPATAGGALTPDHQTLIMGLAESILPSQAVIAGVDPESADVLWSIPLPQEEGWFLRASGIPAITADGSRAYVPVLAGTLARGNVSYLYAIDLCDGPAPCRADLDGDGELTFFDFLAFQNLFAAGDLRADFDGDGDLTFFDFLGFQNEFAAGCP